VITHPTAAELTEAVADWIESVRPSLTGRDAFLARVAANALGAVQRELTQGPAAQEAAVHRLQSLMGITGAYPELIEELCRRLQAGEMTVDTPGLLALLRADVLDRLAIDQPTYAYEGRPDLAARSA